MTEQDLFNQREALQDDLLCILDGLDNEILDRVCDAVCERFDILLKNRRNNELS